MTTAKPLFDRCFCGRPLLDSTGRCAPGGKAEQGHDWPGTCDGRHGHQETTR